MDCLIPRAGEAPAEKLVDTGCVDPSDPRRPAASAVSYEVNSPLWSDGADKIRGMALPDGGKIHVKNCADKSEDCLSGAGDPDEGKWVFPVGTVMVKNFGFDKKLVETRLFVHHDADTWVGYSYAWSEDQSGATIVPSDGAEVMFNTGSRTVDWHFPSRDNCMKCHKPTGGSTLGPETAQMNRMADGGGMNQIDMIEQMGLFDNAVPTPYKSAMVTPYPSQVGAPSSSATVEQKARSYLHANCAFCHRPDGEFKSVDLRYDTSFKDTLLCNAIPAKGTQGVENATNLTPGHPELSTIFLRMNTLAKGRMPPLASAVLDQDALAIVSDWIKGIQACP